MGYSKDKCMNWNKENIAMTKIVNSWNEWDPLKHVIVGRAGGGMVQAPEPAVQLDFPDHGFPHGTFGPLPEEMAEKAGELLDNFAAAGLDAKTNDT